ncbi:hypothetical protein [Rubrivirga sp.]|uniref:hypothetical protein n=1 Tax=Rubrivirga sp. TaxID=1885344 RepID=UPI003C76E2A4
MPDSDRPDRRPPLIPSNVAWPAFIVFLLAISITMAVTTFIVAQSDGGARHIEEVQPEQGP